MAWKELFKEGKVGSNMKYKRDVKSIKKGNDINLSFDYILL